MPKKWTDIEREKIHKILQKHARILFEKYGLAKTSIDEIVQAVNISKGAFYTFYTSKEVLYFEILESIEQEFKGKLFKQAFQPGLSRHESFKNFLREIIQVLTTMPIFKHLITTDYQYLLKKLPEEMVKKHVQKDFENASAYFSSWIQKGWIKPVNLKALNGMLLSMFYFVIHRDDLDFDFKASQEMYIDMLTHYLVIEESPINTPGKQ